MSLGREQVRALDRDAIEVYGVPGIVLMENAGRGAADVLSRLGIAGPVVVCCGKGNNGGDGFVIARHLDNHGHTVKVLLFARPEDLTGDAATNYHIVERSGLPLAVWPDEARVRADLAGADWVVDALYGTGLQGPIRPPMDEVVGWINASGRRVLAVDVPSGLDCDTGRPLGPVIRADYTATFVAAKEGFSRPEARTWLGQVHVVDIGAPRKLVERYLQASAASRSAAPGPRA